MAGKSGLNLTKDEPFDTFLAQYGAAAPHLAPMLRAFGPTDVRNWAIALGQELFVGSTGRVFPKAMKASPLLRAWLRELATLGVEIRPRWRWLGDGRFDTPSGEQTLTPKVTVLACGGASWARLGSDGAWAQTLPQTVLSPFQPANMGFGVAWSDHMRAHFGRPIKSIALHAGDTTSRGEIVLSEHGIEGGGIYTLSRILRDGAPLSVDLLPDLTVDDIRARLARAPAKQSLANRLRKALKLDPVKYALLMECARPLPADIAPVLKSLPIAHTGPRPIDQAISTAGGLRFDALDDGLMLIDRPGTFAAGEMLDWEAPTGGYLITACLATGKWAGQHAANWT